MLALLATSCGAVCTRSRIVAEVWGRSWPGANRTLDVHVATLRTKLGRPHLVQTVRGVGYRLAAEPAEPAESAEGGSSRSRRPTGCAPRCSAPGRCSPSWVLLALALAVLVALPVVRWILRPVRRLDEGTGRVLAGGQAELDGLLSLARAEHVSVAFVGVDVDAVVDDRLDAWRPLASHERLTLRREGPRWSCWSGRRSERSRPCSTPCSTTP